jgi:FkbM family methyltransferase
MVMGLVFRAYHALPLSTRLEVEIQDVAHKLKFYKVYSRRKRIVEKVRNIVYELDLEQLIDNEIHFMGCWEPESTAYIQKTVRNGMIAFDIGANIGYFTLLLATLVGPSGRVFSFEPTESAFHKLSRNLELNQFANVTLEKKALSNEDSIRISRINSSFRIDRQDIDIPAQRVIFSTLDKYCNEHDLERIDFLKIDVDGYEFKVIQGGQQTLQKFRPVILLELCKISLSIHGDRLEDLLNLLQRLGYSFHNLSNLREFGSVQQIANMLPEDRGAINIVCLPKRPESRVAPMSLLSP